MTMAKVVSEVWQNDHRLSLVLAFASSPTTTQDTITITSFTCFDGKYRLYAVLFLQEYESLRSRWEFVNVIGFVEI
jgi:hypothetical protein